METVAKHKLYTYIYLPPTLYTTPKAHTYIQMYVNGHSEKFISHSTKILILGDHGIYCFLFLSHSRWGTTMYVEAEAQL